jgi:nickel transport protein
MKPNITKKNLAKHIFCFVLAGCILSLSSETLDAHGVNLFAWVEGDTVYVESKFSGGKRVKAGKIVVTDPQGTELVKGTTNEEGEFSFKVPKKTDLKIVLLAGAAHRAEWTVSAAEFEMPAGRKTPVPQKSPGIKEIIIGIGFILSLTGVAACIRKRKKKNLDHESTKI